MMGSKSPVLFYGRLALLAAGVLYTLVCRYMAGAGEWYARQVYPVVSAILSAMSSVVPFSLEEWLVVAAVSGLLLYPVLARRHKKSWKRIAGREAEGLLWLYVWFYWGWGLNYFRESFYVRAGVKPAAYEEAKFRSFLHSYTDSLNTNYCDVASIDTLAVQQDIRTLYATVPAGYGLDAPESYHCPKDLWFNTLYSRVGVLGYAGPFFVEMQLNEELLPSQHPFTYAHELAHLLGVSSEAEANYWAYRICTQSGRPEVRYSGYMGLLSYVIINARAVMEPETYREWTLTLRDEVVRELGNRDTYWSEKYSHALGSIQDWVYDLFLKGNQITSGKKNYAEVIQMILSTH